MAAPKVTLSARQEGSSIFIKSEFGGEHTREYELSLNHPLAVQFLCQGFNAKIRSQVSAAKTPEEAVAAYDQLAGAFAKGNWNAQRNAGAAEAGGILVRALARLKGRTIEQAQAFVSQLSKKQQADLRKVPEVASAIAQLTEESGEVDAEATSLLDAFGGSDEVEESPTNDGESRARAELNAQ
jgi:hypothetical protein